MRVHKAISEKELRKQTEDLTKVRDAMQFLLGRKLGNGGSRNVYEYAPNPNKFVVKVAIDAPDNNIIENLIWDEAKYLTGNLKIVKDWLCPVEHMSPDGWFMICRKATPCGVNDIPDKLPSFVNWDVKPDNFGWLEGRLVCIDYGSIYQFRQYRTRMTKVGGKWWLKSNN